MSITQSEILSFPEENQISLISTWYSKKLGRIPEPIDVYQVFHLFNSKNSFLPNYIN